MGTTNAIDGAQKSVRAFFRGQQISQNPETLARGQIVDTPVAKYAGALATATVGSIWGSRSEFKEIENRIDQMRDEMHQMCWRV